MWSTSVRTRRKDIFQREAPPRREGLPPGTALPPAEAEKFSLRFERNLGIVEKEREGRMQHDPDGLCGRPERHGLQLPPQSRDRAVRADLLAEVGEACLWVSGATARQFPAEEQSRLCVDESFLEKAGPGSPALWRTALWRLCRACGAGGAVPLGPGLSGGPLLGPVPGGLDSGPAEEFPGFSHEIITKEVYIP